MRTHKNNTNTNAVPRVIKETELTPRQVLNRLPLPAESLRPTQSLMDRYLKGEARAVAIIDAWKFRPIVQVRVMTDEEIERLS